MHFLDACYATPSVSITHCVLRNSSMQYGDTNHFSLKNLYHQQWPIFYYKQSFSITTVAITIYIAYHKTHWGEGKTIKMTNVSNVGGLLPTME